MGRIKTRLLKAATQELFEKHADEMTQDFDTNKKIVASKLQTSSKKMRNIIAGYATRLKKAQ